jgi:hypothetical protein
MIRFYNPSGICNTLITQTQNGKLSWVDCDSFIEHIEIEGLSVDGVPWFHNYLKYLQMWYYTPQFDKTFIAFFDSRLFVLSRSKYFQEFRLDFQTHSKIWKSVVEKQSTLLQLHNTISLFQDTGSKENCQELLYSTGCIHA